MPAKSFVAGTQPKACAFLQLPLQSSKVLSCVDTSWRSNCLKFRFLFFDNQSLRPSRSWSAEVPKLLCFRVQVCKVSRPKGPQNDLKIGSGIGSGSVSASGSHITAWMTLKSMKIMEILMNIYEISMKNH